VPGRDGTRYVFECRGGNWYWTNPPDDVFGMGVYADCTPDTVALIDALLAARREWVPVSERLPVDHREVPILLAGNLFLGFVETDETGARWVLSWMPTTVRPSHWLDIPALPAAPKEETREV
jgi:hypothetical protein